MRELRIRAWDKRINKFRPLDGYERMAILNSTDFEIMQFTGLRDKNGKEIYEGDIIKYVGTTAIHPATVVFDNGMFGIKDSGPIYPLGKLLSSMVFAGGQVDLEVIGNIHENPELVQMTGGKK